MGNTFNKKSQKMTLQGYYAALPSSVSEKKNFINEVIFRTGVTSNTVRNWVHYGMRPSNPEHIKVLVELTGIPEDELWEA